MAGKKESEKRIEAKLRPRWGNDTVQAMDVSIAADCGAKQGDILFRFQKETVTIPFCPIQDLSVQDDLGDIPLSETETEEYPVKFRCFAAERTTRGKIRISYHLEPRDISNVTHYGPYFDFRSEWGGANGAGVTCMPLLPEGTYRICLKWDLDGMPEHSRGVWSFGEGDQEREGTTDLLLYSFYAVGLVQSVADERFGFYWFGQPPFDVKQAAENVKRMYGVMAEFFGDPQTEGYRVFARKDPFEKSGGTALARSFLFGYNDTTKTTVESLQNLLAHEMVHNWPHMDDHPYGSCTWFTEGTAEFYSVMLPFRSGIVSLEDTLIQIQERTDQYFANPTVELSNQEAAGLFWSDRRTQRLAYGRGFFFLANVDCAIRRATKGERSIDDVVKPLTAMYLSGTSGTNQDFIRLVREVSGLDIQSAFEDMENGVRLVPDPDSFDGCFSRDEVEICQADSEKKTISYQWKIRSPKTET